MIRRVKDVTKETVKDVPAVAAVIPEGVALKEGVRAAVRVESGIVAVTKPAPKFQHRQDLRPDQVQTPSPESVGKLSLPNDQRALQFIRRRPGYFSVVFSFLTASAVVKGVFHKKHRIITYLQRTLLLAMLVSGIVVFNISIPAYDRDCCYKPHVTRTDLGDCNDHTSPIYHETVGRSNVKQHCGSYPFRIVALLLCFFLSLFLALSVHAAQIYECSREYRAAVMEVISSMPADFELETDGEASKEAADAVLYIAGVMCGTADWIMPTYYFFESFLFGYPLTMIHGVVWVVGQIFLTFASLITFLYYFVIYEKLWRAWCCYSSHTSIFNYNDGLCYGKHCRSQDTQSYIPVMLGCTFVILKFVTYYAAFKTSKRYTASPTTYLTLCFPKLRPQWHNQLLELTKR